MVEFDINIHEKEGIAYFAKKIRETLGHKLKLRPGLKAGVLYPRGTPLEVVLESLDIIRRDFEHQIKLEKEAQP